MLIPLNAGLPSSQEVSWRSRIASLQKSDLLGLTQPPGTTPQSQASDRNGIHSLCLCLRLALSLGLCVCYAGVLFVTHPPFPLHYIGRRVLAFVRFCPPEVEASTGESEAVRWARESKERRQARAQRKLPQTGEVRGSGMGHLCSQQLVLHTRTKIAE